MSESLDRLREKIRALSIAERLELWQELAAEFGPSVINEEYESSVEAAWDEEIESRVKDVVEGRVKLISMEESDRQIAELFAKHGIRRDRESR
jgi:putative addiction module component (TIGR02574 family)